MGRPFGVCMLALVSALPACGVADDGAIEIRPTIRENIVYGHKHGLAMVFNVFRPVELAWR